jgi:hypothetical protein
MPPSEDTDLLTPDERFTEVASILAAGILRLHTRAALSEDTTNHSAPENLAESASPGLEVSDETVLSVPNG